MDESSLEDHGIRTLTHTKSGSICQIHDFGATVISFHPSPADESNSEVLFVSRLAHLNGSKPIRGGIPICFPIFGPPADADASDMPQHGFARKNFWKYDRKSAVDTEDSASMSFHLKVDPSNYDKMEGRGTKGLWSGADGSGEGPGCHLIYTVTITANSMTCLLRVENTGKVEFPIQALLHTYYEVHNKVALDGSKCNVTGLSGYEKIDKVDASKNSPATTDDKIVVDGETDHVYNPPKDKDTVDVKIEVNAPSGKPIRCTAQGRVDNTNKPISCVVWNPHETKAKGMSDFADEQYHEMICVEPGLGLGGDKPPVLQPNKVATLEMTIQV